MVGTAGWAGVGATTVRSTSAGAVAGVVELSIVEISAAAPVCGTAASSRWSGAGRALEVPPWATDDQSRPAAAAAAARIGRPLADKPGVRVAAAEGIAWSEHSSMGSIPSMRSGRTCLDSWEVLWYRW